MRLRKEEAVKRSYLHRLDMERKCERVKTMERKNSKPGMGNDDSKCREVYNGRTDHP
jgi:hypothetical protein